MRIGSGLVRCFWVKLGMIISLLLNIRLIPMGPRRLRGRLKDWESSQFPCTVCRSLFSSHIGGDKVRHGINVSVRTSSILFHYPGSRYRFPPVLLPHPLFSLHAVYFITPPTSFVRDRKLINRPAVSLVLPLMECLWQLLHAIDEGYLLQDG